MAELATLARPYARALFQIAMPDQLDAWVAVLDALTQLSRHPDVRRMITMPQRRERMRAVLVEALKPLDIPQQVHVENFVQLLLDNRRFSALPEIAAQFNALKRASEGVSEAEIVSAFPIEDELLKTLNAALERRFGRQLKPKITVDPSLIGGICVTVGDQVLDTSVRARLARMRAELSGN